MRIWSILVIKSGLKWCIHLSWKTKRRRSDPVLWQKPLHQQKCQKGNVTTQTTPQRSSIKQRLRTDLGLSVGITTATQLVWLTWFTGPPFHSPQQPCNQKDTQSLFLYSTTGECHCWWTSESQRAHVAKFYGRFRLIRSVLIASKFSVLKLFEIVILGGLLHNPFWLQLVLAL